MQQRRAAGLGVETESGADPRHSDRVHDEVLAGESGLAGVGLVGELPRPPDGAGIDREVAARTLGRKSEQVVNRVDGRSARLVVGDQANSLISLPRNVRPSSSSHRLSTKAGH